MQCNIFKIALILAGGWTAGAWAQDTKPCRTLKHGMRIDTAEKLAELADVCVVEGIGLGLFVEGIPEITLERLERVEGTINIESHDLEAIAMPSLKHVGMLRISGPDLEVAEFPRLRDANDLYVKTPGLKSLNFPELGRVGLLSIVQNPALEFVFFDALYDVGVAMFRGNPNLNPSCEVMVKRVTRTLTPEEQDEVRRGEEKMHELREAMLAGTMNQPPPTPTGHPVEFGSIGFYYSWYPYQYWNHWKRMAPWGYSRFYYFLR